MTKITPEEWKDYQHQRVVMEKDILLKALWYYADETNWYNDIDSTENGKKARDTFIALYGEMEYKRRHELELYGDES